ncbi:response regulator [Effusibacillus pohliae]|uniref:response regulator n=1 Tax=Effusibacillus pohliae TaxID=232270 RepID=UPI00036C65D2|nr:response regulator transcription factor [Effusibacillus pohliae]
MKIRILLVDDHAVVLKGLSFFLGTQPDFELVGEAGNGTEALEKVAELQPDVVLMDLVMPEMDGIEATAQIKRHHPSVKVLVLTSFSEQDQVLPALRAGASGYLLKDVQPDQLAEAIRGAYSGNVQLHPEITHKLMAEAALPPGKPAAADPLDELTQREREVLGLLAQGMSNKEIAAALHIAEKTVKTHVSSILGKLELADRTQAALYAVKRGIAQ